MSLVYSFGKCIVCGGRAHIHNSAVCVDCAIEIVIAVSQNKTISAYLDSIGADCTMGASYTGTVKQIVKCQPLILFCI